MPGPPRRRSGWSRNTLADAARTAALEVLRAVRAADAYTNLALPAALQAARAERPRRGLRDGADVGDGTPPGPVRRRDRGVRRPAARQGAGAGARRAAAGHPPAAGHAGARARRDQHHGRPGALRRRAGGRRLRQRGAAEGLGARPRRLGGQGGARPDRGPGRSPERRPRPPAVGRRSACGGGRGGRGRGPVGRRQRTARRDPGGPARPVDARGAARASRRAGRRTACT